MLRWRAWAGGGAAMKTYRIGVIGLGQRIAHVLAAMEEVGWGLEVAGQVDPAPVGAPILAAAGIAAGPRRSRRPQACWPPVPTTW